MRILFFNFIILFFLLDKKLSAEDKLIHQGGVCVEIGIKDLSNINEFIKSKNILIQGLVIEENKIDKLKEELMQQNVYGKASIDFQSFSLLPYESNLINLVIINELEKINGLGFKLEEAFRILAPGGKIKIIDAGSEEVLKKVGFINIQKLNKSIIGEKPRPKEMDEWTHARYSPERTATSKDLLVGPSDSMRWIDEPRRFRSRPAAVVTANGKFFYIYDYAPAFVNVAVQVELVARDAFNGMILWKKPIKCGSKYDNLIYNGEAVVASGNFLYAPLEMDGDLNKIDANTGEIIKTYLKSNPISTILFQSEILILSKKSIKLLSEASGDTIWEVPINTKDCSIAVYQNKIYTFNKNATLKCYHYKTGETILEKTNSAEAVGGWLVGFINDFAIISGQKIFALSLKDGSQSWCHEYKMSGRGSPINVFFSQNKIWVHHINDLGSNEVWRAIDPKDGSVFKEIPAIFRDKCAPGKATENFLISGRMSFTNTISEKSFSPQTVRATCAFGPLPANGLIYNFPTNCRCYPHLKGILATGTLEEKLDSPIPEKNKVIKGTGVISKKVAGENDWPIYRGNNQRLGSQKNNGPKTPKMKWARQLPGELTPSVVAGGKVFVCAKDMHTLYALKEEDGAILWQFNTGGRLISPPTYSEGALYLGSNDGWAYAISAEDGKLIWKYRLGPNNRKMVAYNQLESLWPMIGSILVHDNKAFLAAGRHTGFDGGIYICALKADTGEVIWESKLKSIAVLDIFVMQDNVLRLGKNRIDMNTGEPSLKKMSDLYLSPGISSPFDNNVYANRTSWEYDKVVGQMLSIHGESVIGFTSFSLDHLSLRKEETNSPGQGQYKLFTGNLAGRGDFKVDLPIRPEGIVLAGEYIYLAGKEDLYPATKSMLLTYHAKTCQEIGREVLPETPVFDGIVVANEKLFLSTKEGKMICYDSK